MRGLKISKQSKRPDTPLAETPDPTSTSGGTYYASSNGRVGRLSGSIIGNTIVDTRNESIDTTGYSKGKKEFKIINSSSNEGTEEKKVKREDVPKVISELKKGATSVRDYRTFNQKKTNRR